MAEAKRRPEPNFQVLSLQQDDGDGRATLQARRYQKRKTHPKSRAGCIVCKARRVKCDETKPSCKRCLRGEATCAYAPASDEKPEAVAVPTKAAGGGPDGDLALSRETQFGLSVSSDLDPSSSSHGTPRMILFQHYHAGSLDEPYFNTGGPSTLISLALQRPLLLDTLLAISACHLRHHAAPSSSSPHRVAEHFHKGLALRRFQTALAEPLLDQQACDTLLTTATLLNQLSLTLDADEGADPAASWVFGCAPARLGWLGVLMGFKPLLLATSPFHAGSILRRMFDASDDAAGTFASEGLPLTRVPGPWLRLFGLRREDAGEGTAAASIFFEPVRVLAELTHRAPDPRGLMLVLSSFRKLDMDFRVLLEQRDERATWILGYWLGLLRRYDPWWLRGRSRRDHRAVVLWLEGRGVRDRPGEEGRAWAAAMDDLEMAPFWHGRSEQPLESGDCLPNLVQA